MWQVSCVGEPIGAIVAESRDIARHAAKMVKIQYEDLPAVFTIDVSMQTSTT